LVCGLVVSEEEIDDDEGDSLVICLLLSSDADVAVDFSTLVEDGSGGGTTVIVRGDAFAP